MTDCHPEISALKRLSHRHLVEIVGSYTDEQCYAFLMKPVADCNLHTYLSKMKANLFPTLRTFFGCLAEAVAYLHFQKIHHMDIKPQNILINEGEIYLADFGAAHDWTGKERSTTWASMPRTISYCPPEVGRDPNAPRNYATDIWSLGVVFLEMVTVLRNGKLKAFRAFLTQHGTKHQFVWGNAPATYKWLEILRQSDAGPECDNEPLSWVKDMLERRGPCGNSHKSSQMISRMTKMWKITAMTTKTTLISNSFI